MLFVTTTTFKSLRKRLQRIGYSAMDSTALLTRGGVRVGPGNDRVSIGWTDGDTLQPDPEGHAAIHVDGEHFKFLMHIVL